MLPGGFLNQSRCCLPILRSSHVPPPLALTSWRMGGHKGVTEKVGRRHCLGHELPPGFPGRQENTTQIHPLLLQLPSYPSSSDKTLTFLSIVQSLKNSRHPPPHPHHCISSCLPDSLSACDPDWIRLNRLLTYCYSSHLQSSPWVCFFFSLHAFVSTCSPLHSSRAYAIIPNRQTGEPLLCLPV